MQEDLIASSTAFVVGASLTCFIGVGVCFLLKHILRKRLGEIKYFAGLIIAAHLIAYTLLFINPHTGGTIGDKTITAGLIALALIPAFILSTIIGKPPPKPGTKPDAKKDKEKDAKTAEPLPDFSEGLKKGLSAFVALWVFFTIYLLIFNISITAFGLIWPTGTPV